MLYCCLVELESLLFFIDRVCPISLLDVAIETVNIKAHTPKEEKSAMMRMIRFGPLCPGLSTLQEKRPSGSD